MGFLANLLGWGDKSPPLTETERQALTHAVTVVDPLLKTVSGYEKHLATPVRNALAYCDGLVAAVPGPVEVNSHAFAADPLVHALFATCGDIAATLGKSRAVKAFLAEPANALADEFYALLGMRRFEKNVIGMAVHGDMVCADTPQRLLYFADHTLRELSPDIEETRRGLRAAAFDSLATSFASQLAEMRQARQDLHNEWDMQRALSSRPHQSATLAAEHTQRSAELEERLRQAAETLSPERLLDALAAWLAAPELHLHLDPTTVSVDRMGVMVDPTSTADQVSTLSLPELIGRDRRHWIVLIAKIHREEALRGLAQQQADSRYIII
ncbi:MAG: hypothetical protein HY847_05550 [Betaproteobacteria bacterium]|nr:hypothetical protein [Betaproteobacteria bacterium]